MYVGPKQDTNSERMHHSTERSLQPEQLHATNPLTYAISPTPIGAVNRVNDRLANVTQQLKDIRSSKTVWELNNYKPLMDNIGCGSLPVFKRIIVNAVTETNLDSVRIENIVRLQEISIKKSSY